MFGKADPYTILNVGNEKFKSKTINNNHNPEWNFSIQFELNKGSPDVIDLEVYDEDMVGKDDPLGQTKLHLNHIIDQRKIVNAWIPLQQCKSGKIMYSAEFIPSGSQPKQKPLGTITLTLHRAKDIEKKGIMGKADPYAILKVGNENFRSQTVKNNHNPEWNHDIKFDVDDETPEEVTLEVFDEDIGKDDALGKATICLREIINHKKVINQWIKLEDVKTGDVLFSAEYVPSEETEEEKIPVEGHARKESVASVHSQKVDSRKASLDNSIELRKQSQGSIQSEKKESRKHSRVSEHDHSGKEDTEDEETDVKLSRKQSKGSIHSEKVGSRKQSRVSAHGSRKQSTVSVHDISEKEDTEDEKETEVTQLRKQSEASIHSEKFVSRKQSTVSIHDQAEKGDTEDEEQTNIKQSRKESKASVHSEKVESRKQSRVSAHDHSENEDEQKVVQDDKNVSSIKVDDVDGCMSSKQHKDDEKESDKADQEKQESLSSGSIKMTIHKAKDLDGHWFDRGEMGRADPYAVLTIGTEKLKSKTVPNNHSPEWNYEAIFDITDDVF
jgi:Ca2+-dependent lipid-binding protein